MVNLLRPRKSLGSLNNKDKAFPLTQGSSTPGRQDMGDTESRWSGENLAPSDGYSGLVSLGLLALILSIVYTDLGVVRIWTWF